MSKAGMMCDCEYNCQTNNDQELKHNFIVWAKLWFGPEFSILPQLQ